MDENIISIIIGSAALIVGLVVGKLLYYQPYFSQYEITYKDGATTATAFISGTTKGDALRKFELAHPLKIVLSVKRID